MRVHERCEECDRRVAVCFAPRRLCRPCAEEFYTGLVALAKLRGQCVSDPDRILLALRATDATMRGKASHQKRAES